MDAIRVKTVSSEVPTVYRDLLCKYNTITKPPNLHAKPVYRLLHFEDAQTPVIVATTASSARALRHREEKIRVHVTFSS